MTFVKNDPKTIALSKKGNDAKAEHKETLWAFVAGGGLRKYHELLDKQLDGEEIPKASQKGMDRVETLLPYTKGKQGNVDKKGETIPTNVNILNLSVNELERIAEGTSN